MDLKVTIVQSDLSWESPEENLENFSNKIHAISEETDIVILPEMFTTGFSMNAEILAENQPGTTLNWMRQLASKKNAAITGSIIVKEEGFFYNRLYFVFPDGSFQQYDKRHTFTLAGEHKIYAAGAKKIIIDFRGWRICPLICYDLRFPVWARNTEDYDLLIYVANWPEKRIAAWDALLKARAIENMAYCAGVNRIGEDGNGHPYVGHSAVYDVLGEQISKRDFEASFTQTIQLSKSDLENYRKQLQFLNDRDDFTLK